jgi:2,3-dihydroxybenzoate decarboxylase
MTGKITLEDHFATPDTLPDSERYFLPEGWREMRSRLLDIRERRLREMDAHGIETMILSLNSPAIQAIHETGRAIEIAKKANDFLAAEVANNPGRFQAFAALPMQDPDAASREMERCVRELGFRGAMVNGFSQVGSEDTAVFYDLPRYLPFWATVEKLGVPFYLHPREPLVSRQQHYEGHPWFLGAAWAFGVETSIHALRLMASGLFDRYPALKMILGHLGEGLPYNAWRIDHRIGKTPRGIPAKKTITQYLRTNFFLTTSGNFRTSTLLAAIAEVGADRILFSVDYPFEEIGEGTDWFDRADISDADRSRIGRENALQLFRLGSSLGSKPGSSLGSSMIGG